MFGLIVLLIISCSGSGDKTAEGKKVVKADPIVASGKVDIRITIQEQEAGTAVLGAVYGDQYYGVEQVDFDANGTASIVRDNPYRQGLYFLQLPDNGGVIQFLLGPDQEFSLNTNFDRPIKDMKVEGSVDNELFFKHLAFQDDYQKEFKRMTDLIKAAEKGSSERTKLEEDRDKIIEARRDRIALYDDQAPGSLFADFIQSGPISKNSEAQEEGWVYR